MTLRFLVLTLMVSAACAKDPWQELGMSASMPKAWQSTRIRGSYEMFEGVSVKTRSGASITIAVYRDNAHGGSWGTATQHAAYDSVVMSSHPSPVRYRAAPPDHLILDYDFVSTPRQLKLHEHKIYLDRQNRHVTIQLLCDAATTTEGERELTQFMQSVHFNK